MIAVSSVKLVLLLKSTSSNGRWSAVMNWQKRRQSVLQRLDQNTSVPEPLLEDTRPVPETCI